MKGVAYKLLAVPEKDIVAHASEDPWRVCLSLTGPAYEIVGSIGTDGKVTIPRTLLLRVAAARDADSLIGYDLIMPNPADPATWLPFRRLEWPSPPPACYRMPNGCMVHVKPGCRCPR